MRGKEREIFMDQTERHQELRFSSSAVCGCGEPDCTCDAGATWPTDRELPLPDQTACVLRGLVETFDALPRYANVPVRLVLAIESVRTYLQQNYDLEIRP